MTRIQIKQRQMPQQILRIAKDDSDDSYGGWDGC
jgi:hypothetical protein